MVPIPKPDGTVRVTVDYTELNKFVQREFFEMSTVDECLATIGTGAKFLASWMPNGDIGRYLWRKRVDI